MTRMQHNHGTGGLKVTCKDCIHYEACERMISDTSKMFKVLLSEILKMNCDIKYDSTNILSGAEICQCFQDRSRFVELPCKLGDTVYIALNGYGVLKDTVKEFRITSKRIWIRPEKFGMDCLLENMAFLTREEAEQALKEREENEKTDD